MNIAVVGAGFCGLATSWFLLQKPEIKVTLFDAKGIGAGASGIASGLLHCYAGPKAQKSWQADCAFPETIKLLDIASLALRSAVYDTRGILRPEAHGMDFSERVDYPDVEWWEAARCQEKIPELLALPSLFIRSGITVNCPAYLEGLWLACQKKGAKLQLSRVQSADDLKEFDQIIFSAGAYQNQIAGLTCPPVELIKGQTLQLEWTKDERLPFALNAGVQISQIDLSCLFAGATFERKWTCWEPEKSAELEIRKKIALISPTFAKLTLQGIWAGFRAATKDKKPFIYRQAPNVWCIGGMGSKGLLYHAWMAKQLSQILQNRGYIE